MRTQRGDKVELLPELPGDRMRAAPREGGERAASTHGAQERTMDVDAHRRRRDVGICDPCRRHRRRRHKPTIDAEASR